MVSWVVSWSVGLVCIVQLVLSCIVKRQSSWVVSWSIGLFSIADLVLKLYSKETTTSWVVGWSIGLFCIVDLVLSCIVRSRVVV